ncbi:MAG: YdcF family protein [Alphaproteobacteria bacterium]|nr:YdcF family protein [Alphaproteobacteria bacterium]
MFFAVSKIFWILAAPSHWLGLLILAGALCLFLGRLRAARRLMLAAVLVLVVAGMSPLGGYLVRAIENQYPRGDWSARVDGILILGGGYNTWVLRTRHAPATNGTAYRLTEAYAAARHYPNARVVFSGGSGVLGGVDWSEAETARYVLTGMGLDSKRLILEPRSRNTYENILYSKAMVKPKPGEVWLLVTSAVHMPRAMAIARKLDWPMLAWPSDYITGPDIGFGGFYNIGANLEMTDFATHEAVGLVAYRLTGKSQ